MRSSALKITLLTIYPFTNYIYIYILIYIYIYIYISVQSAGAIKYANSIFADG